MGSVVIVLACLSGCATSIEEEGALSSEAVEARLQHLVRTMGPGKLQQSLSECSVGMPPPSPLAIGHRGAPLWYPEHTEESYRAAAAMGATVLECDVTFTRDSELVCRHSQCDLHTTTDILSHPDIAAKCRQPFVPYNPETEEPAQVQCCTSDITLAEFRRLKGKADRANPEARTAAEYMVGEQRGTLLTHAESIVLFDTLGVAMTPELKAASVSLPYRGMSREDLAQRMIDDYRRAGIDPARVFPQSFHPEDVAFWIAQNPAFGKQAVLLDGRYALPEFDHRAPETWRPSMSEIKAMGVNILAPPLWMLLETDAQGQLQASGYARAASDAGLALVAWTVDRPGELVDGAGWYYRGLKAAVNGDGSVLAVIDALVNKVGVAMIFSDWPASVAFYDACRNN